MPVQPQSLPEPDANPLNEIGAYEAAIEKIEATLTRLERGDLPLMQIFQEFEEAVADLQACETFLQARQAQVDLLIETLED